MKYIKPLTAAVLSGLAAYFHIMAAPVVLLVLVMVIDYISGMTKAWMNADLSSKTGLRGIIKKLCYLLVVCAAAVVDWLITTGLGQIGIKLDMNYYVGVMVTIWLIINELISILENLSAVGVPLPGFLMKIVKRLKNSVDEKGGSKDGDNSGN